MPGFKFQTSLSSGKKGTGDSPFTALTGPGWVTGITVLTDGTNDATAVVYDNTAGSGKVVAEHKVVAGNNYGGRNWVFPVRVNTGITMTISGTNAEAILEYIPNV